MARYKITLTQTSWTGGTAAFWFDPDVGTAYDAETGGDAITSIIIPTRSGYTFLGFGLTSPYYRVIDESGNILATKVAELFNAASTAVTGSLAAKTLSIYQAQTSTISGATATLRTITIANTYWKGAPAKLYYNPAADKFYLDQAQTQEQTNATTARRECWTYGGCFAGAGPQYVSITPAKSGDQYIDASGAILAELRIRAKVQTFFTINPRGEYFSFKIALDANGGTIGDGGVAAIYRPTTTTGTYYTSYLCEAGTEITSLAVSQLPALASKVYGGFTNTKVTNASGAAAATYYADAAGTLNIANLDALPLSPTGNVALVSATVYARWVGICAITINKGTNGTNASLPMASFYADTVNGHFYADADLQDEISNIGVPANECYRFAGCYNAAAGATQYVDAAGDLTASLAIPEYTTAFTVYCQWVQTSWRLVLNKTNGSGGPDAIYRSTDDGDWYADPLAASGETTPIASVTPPEREGYVFLGYFKTTAATSLDLIARDGALNVANLETLAPSGTTPPSATAYAVWQQLRTVNVDINATSSTVGALNVSTAQPGDEQLYYGLVDDKYYSSAAGDEETGVPARPVALPVARCNVCTGVWSLSANGEQKFDGDGLRVSGASAPTSAVTPWYAQWQRKSYVAVLDNNGGTVGTAAIFYDGETSSFYADDDLASEISTVVPPVREGYSFLGYYTARTSGTLIVDAEGNIMAVSGFGSRDVTLYAHWRVNTYTLAFEGGGELAAKSVTFGEEIGELPEPEPSSVPPDARFNGWLIDNVAVSDSTVWSWPEDKVATARWRYSFGDVEDFFELATASLVPFESDDGHDRPHVVTRHYGKDDGASQTGPNWINPVVKYVVVDDMTLSVLLGKAFGAEFSRGAMTRTGYMIVSAEVETVLGKFPVVTVRGVANEGADAINKFPVSVPIQARALPQNLLGVISSDNSGGALQSFKLSASCTPVVVQERLAPCASDVVGGVYEVDAETSATAMEGAPQTVAASGFVAVGEPAANSSVDFTLYRLKARKGIV